MDNRLNAALFISMIIIIAVLQQNDTSQGSGFIHHVITVKSNNLILETIQQERLVSKKGGYVKAEFTPFFFLPVPINHAGKELLVTLPGIGPGMAERVITYRKTGKKIKSPEDLLSVRGIGPAKMKALRDHVSYE